MGVIGERNSPFEGAPWSVCIPARPSYKLVAKTACEIGVCSAPGEGRLPARIIAPNDVGQMTRGSGSNTRHVANILPEDAPADSLLVVKVITRLDAGRATRRTSTTTTA